MNKHTGDRFLMVQRVLCLFFVLTLLIGVLPGTSAQAADKKYGRVNMDEVRFRRKAESTDVWASLNTGWVVEILSEKRSGGVNYYYVVTNIPKHMERQYWGYIAQQYITVMTAEEVTAWEQAGGNSTAPAGTVSAVTATPAPATLTNYAQPTSSSVNYYSFNGTALSSLGLLDVSAIYYVSGSATIADNTYYIVTVNDTECYVRATNMVLLTSGGETNPATDAPAATQPANAAIGTLRIKPAGNTNMRSSAQMLSGNIVAKIKQGTELPYYYTVTPPSGNHIWYYCYDAKSGNYGYIVDDCVTVLTTVVTPTPTPATNVGTATPGASTTVAGYIRITPKGKTNIRKATQVGTNNVVAQAEQGDILPYYAMSVVNKATWYYVYYAPKSVFGYVLGTCAERTDGSTGAPTLPPQSVVTPTPDPNTIKGYIKFTAGGVNLRKTASLSAAVLGRFDKGQIVPYYGIETRNGTVWYQVRLDDKQGYVHGNFCQTTDINGSIVTPAPDSPITQGYLMTTADKVYVRKKAASDAGTYGQVKTKGTVLPIIGATVRNGSVNWYCVEFEGHTGYIHGKYISVMSQEQINAYLSGQPLPTATPTPTPEPKPVDYIKTIADKVWIRQSPSKTAGTKGQANLGAVFHFTDTTTVSGTKWYKIDYADGSYYIMAKYCQVMTDAEYNEYQNSQPTPIVTATPKPEDMSSTAVTNTEKVIVRGTGASNGKQLALLYKANQVCSLLGNTNVSGGYTWYNVTVNGVTGWIRGDLLRILTKTEEAMLQKTGDPDAKPEASYTTLQLGSTGSAVTALQTKLAEKGYLGSANITGTYDSATRDAIKKFQTDSSLTSDGIAAAATQHALFGTVEKGYYDNTSSTGVQLYKPELIDWYTGGIQSIFYKGCVATLTDVKTGISFKIRRWSGGDHADVEPLTAADTAAMCKVYGVKTAQTIADKDMWQRRPVLITIGTHSYAASIYGEPHNYPAGDTIADNDFYGQFCVHFVNSKLHGGTSGTNKKVDKDHQNAIMYAYNNAVTLLSKLGYTFK